jgi:hypothetical protein
MKNKRKEKKNFQRKSPEPLENHSKTNRNDKEQPKTYIN